MAGVMDTSLWCLPNVYRACILLRTDPTVPWLSTMSSISRRIFVIVRSNFLIGMRIADFSKYFSSDRLLWGGGRSTEHLLCCSFLRHLFWSNTVNWHQGCCRWSNLYVERFLNGVRLPGRAIFITNARNGVCYSYYLHNARFDNRSGSLLFRLSGKILDALKYFAS